MKKRLLSVVALALCSFAVLVGCSGSSAKDITLVSGDKCKFVIAGDEGASYVSAIAEKVNAMTGVIPEICSAEDVSEEQICVAVGSPEDFWVEELASDVSYFGYLIRIWNGDLYILGYDDEVLIEAVTVFLGQFESWNSGGKLKIPGDYEASVALSEEFGVGEVPYFEGADKVGVYDCDDDHHMVLLEGANQKEFETYCEGLASDGFTLYMENEINGNLFKTYYNENGMMLHTYWVEYFEEVRTIVANTELLPIKSEANGEDICTPLLHQMKAVEEEGYIIRLADGRFIIFDGGNPTEENADAIYTFLKENAPDPNNVVIAAWYITHAHEDHGGGIIAFGEKYGSDSSVKLESIMFNPCDTSDQMMFSTSITMDLQLAFATHYAEVPVYKPLTGQVYTFGKTTIEILYTMSDFLPNTIQFEIDGKGGDYNIQSMVSQVDIDSTTDIKDKFFVMGDATTTSCNEMTYRYGDYLKSDYVQVSHHGLVPLPTGTNCRRHGGTVEIYSLIDPDIALWPTSEEKVKERIELEANSHLAAIVDEVVIAGNGARTFEIK